MSTTEPTVIVDPAFAALEAAAAALRADLAARGVPADDGSLTDAVVLALAAQQERIEELERTVLSLCDHARMTRPDAIRWPEPRPGLADIVPPAPIDLDADLPAFDGQVDDVRVFDRVVGPDELRRLVDPPPEAPRWRHDCASCVFLGRSEDGRADLYYCPDHLDFRDLLIARDMDYPGNYLALWAVGEPPRDPHLAEAHRRAAARGLVGGAGAGEGG